MSRTRHVAVVMDLNWPYKRHYEVFAGIRDFAEKNVDWVFHLNNFPEFDLARGKRFDGIVGRIGRDCYLEARKVGIPMVNVWIDSPVADRIPGVHFDSRATGRLAAEHLIVRGFRRLAFFGFKGLKASKQQYEGMCEVAREHGYPCTWHSTSLSFGDDAANWARFVASVKKAQDRWEAPLGVAFPLDELCHAVAAICRTDGWKIPEQVALIGCSNELLICNVSEPTLSSIDRGAWKCGYEAANVLNDLMHGKKPPLEALLIPPKELVVRKSTDTHAVSDPRVALALSHMDLHSSRKLSVSEITQFAGVGRQTLERAFQKHLGRTINEELIRMRISKLKRLLVESEDSIKQLSTRAGFGTTANMFPMFKRHTGMTPKDYREKHGSAPGT